MVMPHVLLRAEDHRVRQEDQVKSERILRAGEDVEQAARDLTERIKRMNALYRDRERNRVKG